MFYKHYRSLEYYNGNAFVIVLCMEDNFQDDNSRDMNVDNHLVVVLCTFLHISCTRYQPRILKNRWEIIGISIGSFLLRLRSAHLWQHDKEDYRDDFDSLKFFDINYCRRKVEQMNMKNSVSKNKSQLQMINLTDENRLIHYCVLTETRNRHWNLTRWTWQWFPQ